MGNGGQQPLPRGKNGALKNFEDKKIRGISISIWKRYFIRMNQQNAFSQAGTDYLRMLL
ncbi:MAG: hypothetical protein IEMM0006_0248 [bacterium]|nr:MAG: hypothetical protein IEMM0006_0248 [bacterium]